MNQRMKGPLIGRGRTAEIYAWGDSQVLKLFRQDWPDDWVEYEVKIARIAQQAGLSAPAVGEELDIGGQRGVIYERVDGPSMLHSVAIKPWTLFKTARQFADLHASIHLLTVNDLPLQRESLKRAINRAPHLTDSMKSGILQRLELLPDGNALCHGDFHPDNILMSEHGPVVIDWMTATQGNPIAHQSEP